MKRFSKAGLLIVTLVIPALIFIFLKFFARNHYDLPYFNPQMDEQGKVVIENGDTLFRKINLVCPEIALADLQGKLTVIGNLSGSKDEDYQILETQLQRIDGLKSEISTLRILALTDSAGLKNADLDNEAAKSGWNVLPVSNNVIENCFQLDSFSNKVLKSGNLSERLMLVDKEGYLRGYYNGKEASETDRLMAEIKILDYEGETIEK